MLQWHHQAVEPAGDARSDLWFMYHLGRRVRDRLAGSTDELRPSGARPDLGLPDRGRAAPSRAPRRCCAEINGYDPDGTPLSAVHRAARTTARPAAAAGSTAASTPTASTRPPAARRRRSRDWLGPEWGWAWPANRRVLYNRASADPDGRPWSERKALVWWDEAAQKWTGHDVPDFVPDKRPDYQPPEGADGPEALSGTEPFIMQADGRAGSTRRPASSTARCRRTTSRRTPRSEPALPRSSATRSAGWSTRRSNRYHPDPAGEPGADVFPFVVTTYRLTEHFTAGGMSRWTPYLAELQPEFFCEVSPQLAELRGLRARRLGDHRHRPRRDRGPGPGHPTGCRRCRSAAAPCTRSACRTTGGPTGSARGDAANELTAMALDPTAHIQEDKALTADIRPGRRPRGRRPAGVRRGLPRAGRHRRAGTGTEVLTREDVPGQAAVRSGARRGRRRRARGPPAPQGLLHRHERLHRLQGVRGRLQGVERGPRGRRSTFTGMSYDNTQGLGADTWRHVAFIEDPKVQPRDGSGGRPARRPRPTTAPDFAG